VFTFKAAVGGGLRRSGSAPVHTLVCIPEASGSSLIVGADLLVAEAFAGYLLAA